MGFRSLGFRLQGLGSKVLGFFGFHGLGTGPGNSLSRLQFVTTNLGFRVGRPQERDFYSATKVQGFRVGPPQLHHYTSEPQNNNVWG